MTETYRRKWEARGRQIARLRDREPQRLLIAARLGRGDTFEQIERETGISLGRVQAVARKLQAEDPSIARTRRPRRYWDTADADMAPPADLDTPEARVTAYIQSNASPNTRVAYGADLRQVADLLGLDGVGALCSIKVAHGARLRELLVGRGYKSSTIRRKMQVVKYLLDREIRLGHREAPNPLDPILVKPPKGEPRRVLDTLTPDEVRRVLAPCDEGTHLRDRRDAALLRLAFWCGLRVGELAGMTAAEPRNWAHQREGAHFVEADGQRLLRVVGKGEKLRVMPLCDEVVEAVQRWLDVSGGSWSDTTPLWQPTRGRKAEALTGRSIRRLVVARCRKAGIQKHISTHSTRRTAAVRLLNLGVDLERVRHFMGHQSLTTTQTYLAGVHDLDTHAARAMDY